MYYYIKNKCMDNILERPNIVTFYEHCVFFFLLSENNTDSTHLDFVM